MRSINIKISKRFYVDLLFGLLLLVSFLRYGLAVEIPSVVMIGISFLIITLGNNTEIIAMCLCCIPLHSSFDYLYVVIYGCIVLLSKNYRKMKIDYVFVVIVIIFFWEILHSIVNVFSIKLFIEVMTPYFLVLMVHCCRRIKIDYHYITMMFVRFVMLIGINLFIRTLNTYGTNFRYALQQMGRLGSLEESVNILEGQINPNSLGVICVLAITMLFQNYLYYKKDKKSIFNIIVLLVIGMLTVSKTYIVLLFLVGCLFAAEPQSNISAKIREFLMLCIIVLFGGLLLVNIFPSIVDKFIMRWTVQDLSSGRLDIMNAASIALQSNPNILWFGVGLQNYSEEVLKYVSLAPHNVFQEIIFAWGVPGLFLFGTFIAVLVRETRKINKNFKIANCIPLVIIIAKAVAGHWITSSYTMLTITLIYLSMLYDFSKGGNI